jgi:hypothetical protein
MNRLGFPHEAENGTMFGHYTATIRKKEDAEEMLKVAQIVQESFA